ncbi:MAG: hypothetical protein GXO60_08065 [Epsilonproteobacteria bacterium]|nr:hypothetical protein [Campylobacterota bacterium]
MRQRYRYIILIISTMLIISGCEEKAKPVIIKNASIKTPLGCLKLDNLEKNKLTNHLKELYNFQDNCEYTLTLKFKKDIVCNSSYNAGMKSMGKFPKSFIQLEVRQSLVPIYSYYVDLFHNANNDDVDMGFKQLKKDILTANSD